MAIDGTEKAVLRRLNRLWGVFTCLSLVAPVMFLAHQFLTDLVGAEVVLVILVLLMIGGVVVGVWMTMLAWRYLSRLRSGRTA